VIMARGEKITLNDIMPRHLRNTGEVSSSVTIQVGATVSNARKQLVLRTFASTGGDADRTAKLLGVSAEDVRADLIALINADGDDTNGAGPRLVDTPQPPRSTGPVKKSPPAKKR
jgi:DNA-binding NtrC family response regulator